MKIEKGASLTSIIAVVETLIADVETLLSLARIVSRQKTQRHKRRFVSKYH